MSSQLWERRFSKCPGGISVKYVGWRFPPKRQKSFVFRTPTRFLIQIFFIGPEKHFNLWKYVIPRHYSSLLVLTSHFSSFSVIPGMRKIEENSVKWTLVSSNDEQWRATVYFYKLQGYSGPIKKIWVKNISRVEKTSEIGVSVCVFGEKLPIFHQKCAKFARFLNWGDIFDSDLFYSTLMAL